MKGDSYIKGPPAEQVKNLGSNPLIVVEIIYEIKTKNVISHVRSANFGDVKQFLGKYELNEPIWIDITVDDFDVYVNSDK